MNLRLVHPFLGEQLVHSLIDNGVEYDGDGDDSDGDGDGTKSNGSHPTVNSPGRFSKGVVETTFCRGNETGMRIDNNYGDSLMAMVMEVEKGMEVAMGMEMVMETAMVMAVAMGMP